MCGGMTPADAKALAPALTLIRNPAVTLSPQHQIQHCVYNSNPNPNPFPNPNHFQSNLSIPTLPMTIGTLGHA